MSASYPTMSMNCPTCKPSEKSSHQNHLGLCKRNGCNCEGVSIDAINLPFGLPPLTGISVSAKVVETVANSGYVYYSDAGSML